MRQARRATPALLVPFRQYGPLRVPGGALSWVTECRGDEGIRKRAANWHGSGGQWICQALPSFRAQAGR